VIVRGPAVVVLVKVAVYVPSCWSVIGPRSVPPEDNSTVSPERGLPLPSVTVAVAVEVETPSATTEPGITETATFDASAHDGAAMHQLKPVAATASAMTAEKRNRRL
jgi:hypothetical protein